MVSGVAMTMSKSMLPALMLSARSSRPTISAPASLAASALSPWANTATRTVLPVPAGSTTEPRTSWSDLRGSMPSCTATSMDSSNLAVAVSLTRLRASATGENLLRSILAAMAAARLDNFAISDSLDVDAHATGAACNRTDGCIEIGSGQVGLLGLGDFLGLGTGERANLVDVGACGALLYGGGLLDEDGRRRRLHDEGEA